MTTPTAPATGGPIPLRGRAALVTGASRRAGIGYAVARRLSAAGASVVLHHHRPHDEAQPWGAEPTSMTSMLADLRAIAPDATATFSDVGADLSEPDAPQRVVERAVDAVGQLDVLVANHALNGSDGSLERITAEMLDRHHAVNTRSTVLLVQAFAAQRMGERGGRVVLLTSGQDLGPMPDELAYAASKGAIASLVPSLADHVADRAITVNAVNPGPVDTGYLTHADSDLRHRFPAGRWGEPDDPARLISWLATDDARWITGQVINSEGGFRRR